MKLICYSLKHLTPVQRMKFQREMYGFKDMSNHGMYTYRRDGLMNSIRHKKLFLTGLFVNDKKAEKIIALLKRHKTKIHIINVKVPKNH